LFLLLELPPKLPQSFPHSLPLKSSIRFGVRAVRAIEANS
jgi:hypothetical protein